MGGERRLVPRIVFCCALPIIISAPLLSRTAHHFQRIIFCCALPIIISAPLLLRTAHQSRVIENDAQKCEAVFAAIVTREEPALTTS